MAYEFRTKRQVEFADTDMAGLMHYSNFFRYMEAAEHAFYRSLGYSAVLSQFDPPLSFPRVHAECDYRKPLRFEDEMEIHLLVREKKTKVLSYLFRFYNLSTNPAEPAAQGILTIVCVQLQPDGSMKPVAIPADLRDQIEPAPKEYLDPLSH